MRVTVHTRYNGSVDKISKKNKKVAGAFIEPLSLREAAKNKQQKNTHTHPFIGPFSGTTRVSRYQKGKTNLDFTEARDSEWQWHQLGRMEVCTSLQTDNHASTPPLRRNNERRQLENYC